MKPREGGFRSTKPFLALILRLGVILLMHLVSANLLSHIARKRSRVIVLEAGIAKLSFGAPNFSF
jgi:hypothetical protein